MTTTKKPQAERVCVETSMRGGYECCPCPAFTPKKEEKR